MAYETPQDPFANTRPCWHLMRGHVDPAVGWTGDLYCALYPHEKGTEHMAVTPGGSVRRWHDHHGTPFPAGY